MTRRPVPELAYFLAGRRLADQLHGQGVEVPQDALVELGRSVIDNAPPVDANDPDIAELLARVQERNPVVRQAIEQAPPTTPELHPGTAEDPGPGEQRALGNGQGDSPGSAQDRTPVRNEKNGPIWEMIEYEPPDDDWS